MSKKLKDIITTEYIKYRDRLQKFKQYNDCDSAFIDYQRAFVLGDVMYKAKLMNDKEWFQERVSLLELYKKIETEVSV